MNLDDLPAHVNQSVRLTFKDGEIVDALLLGVDLSRDRDLTYEVRRIVRAASPPTRGTAIGATVIAQAHDLSSCMPVIE
jgi:hypothetical protein